MSASPALHPPVRPYLGLRYFTEADSDLFFGRDEQVDELLAKLNGSRFVTVIGSSGSGKSSLIGAGLIPALRAGYLAGAGSAWRTARATPGNDPIGNLAARLEEALHIEGAATTLRRGPLGLVETVGRARLPQGENLLVIADQFEELFRYVRSAPPGAALQHARDEAAAFVKLLLEAPAQRELPIYVLLAMRSDFLGDCSQFRNLPERINQGLYLIPRMRRDQLEQAITGPVQVAGEAIAPRLVERVLNDIGEDQDQLPVLQHALFRTWQRRPAGAPLDLAHYVEAGGLSDALGGHADEIYGNLTKRQQELAEAIFRRLTEVDESREIRRPATLDDLAAVTGAPAAEIVPVVDAFRAEDVCFLTQTGRLVDLTHEALIRQWQRLRGWARAEAADRKDFERFADAASTDLERGQWLRGGQLLRAVEWRKKGLSEAWARAYRGDYQQTMRFIDRSIGAQRGARALRFLALVGMIAAVIGFFWWRSKELAAQARLEAESNRAKLDAQQRAIDVVNNANQMISGVNQKISAANEKLAKSFEQEKQAKADLEQQHIRGTAQSLAFAASKDFSRRGDDDLGALLAIQALRFHDRKTPGESRSLIEEPLQHYVSADAFAHVLTGHKDAVTAVATAADGHTIASAGADGQICLWNLRSPTQPPTSVDGSGGAAVTSIAFSPDGQWFAWGNDFGYTYIQNRRSPNSEAVPLTGQRNITSVAFSPDNRRLAAASVDKTVRVYDLSTLDRFGAKYRELAHGDSVRSLSFSADGKKLATAAESAGALVWDLDRPQDRPRMFRDVTRRILAAALTPDGNRVYCLTSGSDPVHIWDVAADTIQSAGMTEALTFALSPDGTTLGVAAAQSGIFLFDPKVGVTQVLPGYQLPATTVTFSPDSRRLITGSGDKIVRVWDLANTPADERVFSAHKGGVRWVAFSPDGAQAAEAGDDGSIRLWGQQTDSTERVLQTSQGRFSAAAFGPDGRHLASAGDDGTVKIWDLRKNPPAAEVFSRKYRAVRAMAFSSDGRHVLTGGESEPLHVWDMLHPDGYPQEFYSNTKSSVSAVAFARDGHRFAVARDDGLLEVMDLLKPNAVHLPLKGHRSVVNSLAFSPGNGNLIAAAVNDKTVLIWDVTRPDYPSRVLSGHRKSVRSVAYSPDGTRLVSTGDDGDVKVWDMSQPNPAPLTVFGVSDSIPSVAFSVDGLFLLSGSQKGFVRVHPLWSAAADELCHRVWRNLSMDEWKFYVGPDIPYERTCPAFPAGAGAPLK